MLPKSIVEVSGSLRRIGEFDEHVIAVTLSPGAVPLLDDAAIGSPACGDVVAPAARISFAASSTLMPASSVS